MTSAHRIIRNSAILFSSHVFTKLLNLALVLVLTRMLGSAGFGVYTFAFAFVIMFMVLANLGINSLLTRDVAREKSRVNEFLGYSLPLLLILSLVVVGGINVFLFVLPFDAQSIAAVRIFSLYLFFDNFSRHFIAVFRAFERMEFEAYTNLSERFIMLAVTLIFWRLGLGLIPLLWGFVGVEFLKMAISFYFLRRFFQQLHFRWFGPETRRMIQQAYPFALMIIFGTVAGRIDTVMLKIFHTNQMVGYYNAAHKLIESLTFIPENIVIALFPALSVLFVQDRSQFRNIFQRTFQYILMLALPLAAGLFLLARPIMQLLFEPEYLAGTIALRWLAVALGFTFLKYHFMITLNSVGKQHRFAAIAAVSMLINVGLNAWWIPRHGLLGASLATVVSEASAVVLSFLLVQAYFQPGWLSGLVFRNLLAALGMAGALLLVGSANLFLLIALAASVYLALVFLLRVFTRDDVNYFLSLVQQKIGNRE